MGREHVSLRDFLIDPVSAGALPCDPDRPVVFLELGNCRSDLILAELPPIPVIGLGDPFHPVARQIDAVVEPPISAESLLRNIIGNPIAAAVTVQLLRSIENLPVLDALTLESIAYGMLQGSKEHASWLAARSPSSRSKPAGRVRLRREHSVLQVVLDRPMAHNAIDRSMRDGLFEAFTLAAVDGDVQRIELLSTGEAFSIGGDLDEFGTTRDAGTAHRIRSLTLPARPLSKRGDILAAHVQGACIGAGLEIAAFARELTAAPNAWFQLPELSMGLIPGAGGTVSIPRRIGRARATLMILSGRRISAETALSWGLIDAIEDRAPVYPALPDLD